MIISEVMKLLKSGKLNEDEKDYIYELVKKMRKGSDLQKRRFYMYYSLGPNSKENNTMPKIARYYDCSVSAIRSSICSIHIGLFRIDDNQILKLKKMVGDKNKSG